MTPDRLLAHFDRLAEAPDSVPRLRRFILDLAVRGKLVEQDPMDEPASELRNRIHQQLIKQGKIKRESALPVSASEQPFSIPDNWAWTRLGQIGNWGSGSTPPRGSHEFFGGGVTWLKSGELNDNEHLSGSEESLTELALSGGSFRQNQPGDVLIAMYGATIGKVAILAQPAVTNQAVCGCTPVDGVLDRYLFKFLLSQRTKFHSASEGGAQPNISKIKIVRFAFPLPPLAEQHRIVAKVDELMALCDRLEAAEAERERRRDRLAAASLHRLNDSTDAHAFREHARFHLHHLPHLTTRPEHIHQFRQTILNLAVRGRLVPQDSNDGPASKLLERIRADKQHRAKQGKAIDDAVVSTIADDDAPFAIPASWAWVRFGKITVSRDGDRIPVSKDERSRREKIYDYYGASGVIDKIDGYLFDKPLLLIGEDGANLINRSTPIAFIARGKYWVNNHAHVVDGISEDFLRFIELQINAIDLKPYVTGTAQPKMNQAKMNSIPIALPPEAEQRRIVFKVDELMTLCDRLEAQLTISETESRRLLEAVLHEALMEKNGQDSELAENAAAGSRIRFARERVGRGL